MTRARNLGSIGGISYLSAAGNSIGIGTTNPQATIHTVVTTGRALFETNSASVQSVLNLWNNNSGSAAGTGILFSAGIGTVGISSFIGGVSAGRIDSNANSLLSFRVLSNGSLTAADNTAPFYVQGNSTGATVVSNVNVGVGTTIPTSRLHVVGDSFITGVVTCTGATVNGNITCVDLNSTSDFNLKENIQTIDNALEIVNDIRGVKFEWKENNKPSIGVIAQEVEKVLPQLVTDTETKTVNYNGLIGVLIESVKELKAENDLLKLEIAKIKSHLEIQ